MKKPEEIKNGLECCFNQENKDFVCDECPYDSAGSTCGDLFGDALAYIQQLESQVPRWISVEDEQKPKHHEDVLCRYVFSGNADCFYAVLTYYAYGDNGYVTGQHFTGEGLHDMRVTHWMPLPEPPKEDAHE